MMIAQEKLVYLDQEVDNGDSGKDILSKKPDDGDGSFCYKNSV
jgi:hypothetical protein